ncbi:MAG TPA: hypothetical protein VE420_15350, partial [Gemmatimonadales bacterium]|nr:hypothetical protein [Gemmatimonadales bacterium]
RQPQSPAITEQAISTSCRGLGLAERSALNEAAGRLGLQTPSRSCADQIARGNLEECGTKLE